MSRKDSRHKQRKAKQREERKRQQRARAAVSGSRRGRLAAAARAPVRDCLVTRDWRHELECSLLLSRNGPHGVACALLLLDRGCLGVKDSMLRDDLREDEYLGILERMGAEDAFEPCEPAVALALAEACVAHAAALGFSPDPGWRDARTLFGDVDPSACTEPIVCGDDGRPVYVPGPDDDVDDVIDRLEERLGRDGFEVRWSDDGPRAGEQPDDWSGTTDEDLAQATGVDLDTAAAWRRVRLTEDRVTSAVMAWAGRHFGEPMFDDAMAELLLWHEVADPDDSDDDARTSDHGGRWGRPSTRERRPVLPEAAAQSFLALYLPWMGFTWRPAAEDADACRDWPEEPLARAWLAGQGDDLDDLDRRFVETACGAPFSFWSVLDVQPGRGMRVRCLLTRREHDVLDRSASTTVRRGALLFGRVVALDGVAVFFGCAGLVIPPSWLPELLTWKEQEFGDEDPLDDPDMTDLDLTVRQAYLDVARAIVDPPPPRLCNTDGEDLVPLHLDFALHCTTQEAFDALADLAHEATAQDLLGEATRDARGALRSVSFPWTRAGNAQHPSWTNTILGHLELDGRTLRVDVNSLERAGRIRALLAERLGDRVNEVSCERLPLDLPSAPGGAAGAHGARHPGAPGDPADPGRSGGSPREDPALADSPEVQALLREHAAAHWEAWFDEPIPALHDRTPREAAADAEGRELLEALLSSYEWHAEAAPAGPFAPDVSALRRRLGL